MTKYVIPVSGGKDSQCVLSMAVKEHGAANCIAVHHYTGDRSSADVKTQEQMGTSMNQANLERLLTFAQHGQPVAYGGSDMMRADLEAVLLGLAVKCDRLPAVADADTKAAYVAAFGSDKGWLGIQGSYFIEGYREGKRTSGVVVADEFGLREHGRGCYQRDENGGRCDVVDDEPPRPAGVKTPEGEQR